MKGIKAGVKLAKALDARVTGLYVIFPYVSPLYSEGTLFYLPGMSAPESRKLYEKQARKALSLIERESAKAGVRCRTRFVTAGQPWQAILRDARSSGCDAIVMGSHGRGGLGGLILGSETTRVLANSKLPVVVVR
jgi:nucleotide-binding universal stress UspA family protein